MTDQLCSAPPTGSTLDRLHEARAASKRWSHLRQPGPGRRPALPPSGDRMLWDLLDALDAHLAEAASPSPADKSLTCPNCTGPREDHPRPWCHAPDQHTA